MGAAEFYISTSLDIQVRNGSFNNCARLFRKLAYRYVILDGDSKFDATVITFLKATGLKPKRTSIQSPWQNRTAERWVGSCRREILDHVIGLDERHLLRLMRDYVSYYHQDRIHGSLEKDTPDKRAIEPKPATTANVTSLPRLGSLRESPHAANRVTAGNSRDREGNSKTGAACLDVQTMQRDSPTGVTHAASRVFIVE
jgi:hypothetical protein